MREGCDALTSDRVAPGGRQDGELQLEVKPRAPVARVDLEFGTHRPDQLAADRETEPRAREAVPTVPPGQPERLVQAHEPVGIRSEEHTSELQSPCNLVCRLLLEKKKKKNI